MSEEGTARVSEEEFTFRAIRRLRKPPYRGIHSVYSGFNQAFKEYFGKNAVEATQRMAAEGKIVTRPVKGGSCSTSPKTPPRPPGRSCRRSWRRRKRAKKFLLDPGGKAG